MKRKHLLAWAMLSSIGFGSVNAADQFYLIKDGVLQEGVVAIEPNDAAPDFFSTKQKAPDGSECVTLTHVKEYTEAKMYIEEGVNLLQTHTLIIDYCFEALAEGNYGGKWPVIQYGFATDTTDNRYGKDACPGWGAFDVKFKHYGKENQWVSDTALVYARPDQLDEVHKLFVFAFNRENNMASTEESNVLYIKNLRLVANEETSGENIPRPFFAENFEPVGLAQTSSASTSDRYLKFKDENEKRLYKDGYSNKTFMGGFALTTIDPNGAVISIDPDWGDEILDGTCRADFKRLWETFGSELNSGSLVEGAENPTPDFSKPFSITPGAYYDTELFHTLFVPQKFGENGVHTGFLNIPLKGNPDISGEISVSFLAKTTSSITEGSNTEIPVFIKFNNSDEIKVTSDVLAPAWTKCNGKVSIPAGAETMDILFRSNPEYDYNIDNIAITANEYYFAKTVEGSGIDKGDFICIEFNANVASIESENANASAYFDGDNFIVKADEEIASISIIDMAGKTASVNGGEFNVSGFNKGIYVFVAKTVNGVSISGKIIIE